MADKKLKILFVASEVTPFVKTGGLADVIGSLPKALVDLGHDARVIMPEYTQISDKFKQKIEHIMYYFTDLSWRQEYVGLNKIEHNGVTTYLIDNKGYFDRPTLYGSFDEGLQFGYFCKAVLDSLPLLDFKPDIIHINDWQTGPIAFLLNQKYKAGGFYQNIKTVYTIHNLRYQGRFPKPAIQDIFGINENDFYDIYVNYMKLGIDFSDAVTTVSDTYSKEILTDYFGEDMNYNLKLRENDLYGIINGINTDEFNPEKDTYIKANYSEDNPEKKLENKKDLQAISGLTIDENIPVIGLISRLVDQKGLDLIENVIEDILSENLQFVLLGTGDYHYENLFKHLEWKYPHKVKANILYSNELAHKIYAGSDMFLMPSLFEPCGLGQLISLEYGTVPIVRETGGLNDTVKSYNDADNSGNGFTFANYNAYDMLYTIRRALYFYNEKKEIWKELVSKSMKEDYSWKHSAREYVEIYKKYIG